MDALTAIQNLTEFRNYFTKEQLIGNFPQNSSPSVAPKPDHRNELTSSHESSVTGDSSFYSSSSASSTSSSSNTQPITAKIVEFRNRRIAGFDINGKTLVCLPQLYEVFLKNMVGGLHTVYTKLRRLEIHPIVCTVEQVRALRSLGAIQAGVNRCKLIECADFEKLYEDCTSTCTRPGRPSKRGPGPATDFEEWNEAVKKEKSDEIDAFNQLMQPTMTTQQLLMQHFVALAQKGVKLENEQGDQEIGSTPTTNEGTPLNLSKSSDSDSVESLRKEDCSPNNSVSSNERGGSNNSNNSMSIEGSNRSTNGNNIDESSLMNKINSLIEIATQQFKHERQELWRERSEIQLLRESFHKIVHEERELRKRLEAERRKSHAYERKFRFLKHQLHLAKRRATQQEDFLTKSGSDS